MKIENSTLTLTSEEGKVDENKHILSVNNTDAGFGISTDVNGNAILCITPC